MVVRMLYVDSCKPLEMLLICFYEQVELVQALKRKKEKEKLAYSRNVLLRCAVR